MLKLLSTFSAFQLIKNYGHIGYPLKLTNMNTSSYLLGKYYNISIIDVNKNIFLLKNYFSLISNVILKSGYLLVVWGSLRQKKYYLKTDFCFFMDRWIPGIITNFRDIKNLHSSKNAPTRYSNKVKEFRFPNFIINFGLDKNVEIQEGMRLPLPFLSIVDTLHSLNKFIFFVLYNTKSTHSSFFLYCIFLDFLEKMFIIKKSFFLNILEERLTALNVTKKN